MRIFITGATGFIGNRLALRLAGEDNDVTVLVRKRDHNERFLSSRIKVVAGDIFNHAALGTGMKSCDTVFHLAAFTRPVSSDPSLPFKTNVTGTMNVLEAAKACSVKKLIVVSTAGTLGFSRDSQPLDENSENPLVYGTDYEKTKAESEKAVLEHATEIPEVIIVNPARVYGPGKDTLSNSVTRIIDLYGKGLWRILPGDGNAIGNYVFIDDVVDGLILAADRGRGGERYILGGENLSFREFFNILGDVHHRHRKLIPLGEPVLKLIVKLAGLYASLTGNNAIISDAWIDKYLKNYILSSNKAVTQLNYKITPFREGAEKTLLWLKNGKRYE